MKTRILICSLALFVGCKEETTRTEIITEKPKAEPSQASSGTMNISLDGKTIDYDDINWKKSSVKNEEDLRLRLLQDGLPVNFEFRFPAVKDALENGEGTFSIPDMTRGLKQIQIKFFDTESEVENKLNKHIVFRKGEIKVRLSNNGQLELQFEGEGGPMVDREVTFPISGSVNIEM